MFMLGLLVGGVVGIVLMAALAAAGRASRDEEHMARLAVRSGTRRSRQ